MSASLALWSLLFRLWNSTLIHSFKYYLFKLISRILQRQHILIELRDLSHRNLGQFKDISRHIENYFQSVLKIIKHQKRVTFCKCRIQISKNRIECVSFPVKKPDFCVLLSVRKILNLLPIAALNSCPEVLISILVFVVTHKRKNETNQKRFTGVKLFSTFNFSQTLRKPPNFDCHSRTKVIQVPLSTVNYRRIIMLMTTYFEQWIKLVSCFLVLKNWNSWRLQPELLLDSLPLYPDLFILQLNEKTFLWTL